MPKKRILSSVLLHIAALVMAVVGCAFVLFIRPGAEALPLAVLWEQHRSLLFGVLVGIGFWITDIVLLVRTRRDGGVLQANLQALFLAVFPLHPAVIATDVLFFLAWTAQAVLCTVLTARAKRPSKARPASAAVQESSLA